MTEQEAEDRAQKTYAAYKAAEAAWQRSKRDHGAEHPHTEAAYQAFDEARLIASCASTAWRVIVNIRSKR